MNKNYHLEKYKEFSALDLKDYIRSGSIPIPKENKSHDRQLFTKARMLEDFVGSGDHVFQNDLLNFGLALH